MLQIKQINSEIVWEDFIRKSSATDFYPLFQSWSWGEVQKQIGAKYLRLGLFDEDKLVGVCLVVEVSAKRGHYLHVRHGPVFARITGEYFDFITNALKDIAKKKNASFIRMGPLIEKTKISEDFFIIRGFHEAPLHNMDAQLCWLLNIKPTEEELLANMRKTHRYTIKKSLNMNIKITRTKNVSRIDSFLKLYSSLYKRKNITPHSGIKEEFSVLAKNNQAMLFFAEFEKKIISAALIVFIDNTAIYHHGASLFAYRHIPASYRIQWEAIREAKRQKFTFYNFWGIAPENQPNHPWQGLTLFKTGFGGYQKEFIHAKDLPVRFSYIKTYLIESFFRLKKGY